MKGLAVSLAPWQGAPTMHIIESREHGLLVMTVSESANDDRMEPDRPADPVQPASGWSPYEVWRTRVKRFRSFDPRGKKDD